MAGIGVIIGYFLNLGFKMASSSALVAVAGVGMLAAFFGQLPISMSTAAVSK